MITRNDDPPEDREAELASERADKLYDLLQTLFEPFINSLLETITKQVDAAYTNGFVDGIASEREADE